MMSNSLRKRTKLFQDRYLRTSGDGLIAQVVICIVKMQAQFIFKASS